MTSSLYNLSRWLLVVAGAASLTVAQAADGSILTPSKRQEALDKAKQLLASREIPAPEADPFYHAELVANPEKAANLSGAKTAEATYQASAPLLGRAKLQAVVAGLKPTFFMRGGQPTFLFGSKKISIGGIMTLTVERVEYTLEIVSVTPPNFTLRLNREQFTRPIK